MIYPPPFTLSDLDMFSPNLADPPSTFLVPGPAKKVSTPALSGHVSPSPEEMKKQTSLASHQEENKKLAPESNGKGKSSAKHKVKNPWLSSEPKEKKRKILTSENMNTANSSPSAGATGTQSSVEDNEEQM